MGKPLPAKKPPDQVRRRNSKLITNLPPEGRTDPAPKWPFKDKPDAYEQHLWDAVWATPQAVMWEQWHLERVVARYVRVTVNAESRDAGPTIVAEARRLESELGLTPKSIFQLQWTLADPKPELASVSSLEEQLGRAKSG